MAGQKTTEWPNATQSEDTDSLLMNSGGKSSKWLLSSFWAAAKAKVESWTFDTLETATKTIIGSINEMKERIDGLNTKFDDYACGTLFFQNLFAYWGDFLPFGAKITGCIAYARKNQKHYTLDFSLTLAENTAAGSEAHDSFTSWGISADQLKSQILNNKNIVSVEGQCDIFVDNQRESTISGGGLNGFGACVEYNKAENEHVIRISRFFNEYGAKGAWSLRHVPAGTVFRGRMEIITE